MKKDAILNGAIVVMALCALAVTGMLIRREFFPPAPQGTVLAPSAVRDWRRFASAGLRIGEPGARVTIVEFSDFQCPACRQFATQLDSVRARYPRDVAILFRHYPLEQIHPHAREAALAAECAAAQGHFTAFHDALFGAQDSIGKTPWSEFARRAQVANTAGFAACVTGRTYERRVQEDMQAGRELGVPGTPTVIVNGKKFTGAGDPEALMDLVDDALKTR